MSTVAVDFDGTLFTQDEDGIFLLIDGARESMCKLRDLGFFIIIYSCRTGLAAKSGRLSREVELMAEVLGQYGVPFDRIFPGEKLVADLYIDDRAVEFRGNWSEVDRKIDAIVNFETQSDV